MKVINHYEEGGNIHPFYNEAMMAMAGIASVGLVGGGTIIIDLGLDDGIYHPNSPPISLNYSPLIFKVILVDPHEPNIATKRHNLFNKYNKLIGLNLECE